MGRAGAAGPPPAARPGGGAAAGAGVVGGGGGGAAPGLGSAAASRETVSARALLPQTVHTPGHTRAPTCAQACDHVCLQMHTHVCTHACTPGEYVLTQREPQEQLRTVHISDAARLSVHHHVHHRVAPGRTLPPDKVPSRAPAQTWSTPHAVLQAKLSVPHAV